MGIEKLLWELRGRCNRHRVQRAKDFDPKNNVKLVQNFKQKDMHCLEV